MSAIIEATKAIIHANWDNVSTGNGSAGFLLLTSEIEIVANAKGSPTM